MGRIINDSSLNIDNYLDDSSVDLVFTDPPYFITSNDWDKQWKNKEEYINWSREWIQLAYNKLKPNGSIYVCISWHYSGYIQQLLEEVGFHIKNRITWKRDKGRGSKTNFKNIHEDIWFCTKSKKDYCFNIDDIMVKKKVIAPYRDKDGNPKDWFIDENFEKIRYTHPGNLWDEFCVPYWSMHEVRSYAKSKREPNNKFQKHPTQKPKSLIKKCILASSNQNDIILDLFGGSGSTAIAAKELKRDYILFETNTEYINITETRLKNETKHNT